MNIEVCSYICCACIELKEVKRGSNRNGIDLVCRHSPSWYWLANNVAMIGKVVRRFSCSSAVADGHIANLMSGAAGETVWKTISAECKRWPLAVPLIVCRRLRGR